MGYISFPGFEILLQAFFTCHETYDLLICPSHSVFSQQSDPADRRFDVFHHDPVSALKFLSVFVHIVSEQAGIYRKGNFGCT